MATVPTCPSDNTTVPVNNDPLAVVQRDGNVSDPAAAVKAVDVCYRAVTTLETAILEENGYSVKDVSTGFMWNALTVILVLTGIFKSINVCDNCRECKLLSLMF